MATTDDAARLEALVDLIVELASGDLSARMPPSPARDNIDAVITGINLLAGELQDVHADLERRVAERTRQLEHARVELERLALRDPLTGLANRNLLNDRLDEAVRQQRTRPPSVLLIDLDQFKTINDSLGHSAGDAVLVEVARRLQSLTWPGRTVARLGGDEFAILIPDASPDQAHDFAARTLHVLHEPFVIEGRPVNAGGSVGLRLGDRESTGELLLRDADTAMYAAKADGRGNVQVYHPEMHNAVQERLTIASGLAEAIRGGQLLLEYQPIVRLADSSMVGAEALVRWDHPERGVIPPSDFVPIAESTGLIVDLGRWVIREAVGQLALWQHQSLELSKFQLHINLSPLELRRPDLDTYVLETLRAHGVDARRLIVELSETALMTTSPLGMNTLRVLRERRGLHRDRRLRHRLFVDQLAAAAADRHGQARPVADPGHRHRGQAAPVPGGSAPVDRIGRAELGGRGRGDRRAGRGVARDEVSLRAGLLLRPSDEPGRIGQRARVGGLVRLVPLGGCGRFERDDWFG